MESFRAQANRRHEAVTGAVGDLRGQQMQLSEGIASVSEAVELEAAAERSLAEVQSLRTCIDAASAQLYLAKDRAHANIAPALESKVRPWLPRITDGRYVDVMVDPSDLTMKVAEASGAVREVRLLSQGTMEQIFLLLRIALSQVLSGGHESAPVILDDVTVQSDLERTNAILRCSISKRRTSGGDVYTGAGSRRLGEGEPTQERDKIILYHANGRRVLASAL